MKIYKTKTFTRMMRRQKIVDADLWDAIERAGRGLIDAELGAGLIKQRVPRPGEGRSGGHRLLLAYRVGDLAVFLYGFAKNERDNIDARELEILREIGNGWLTATPAMFEQALRDGNLHEVIQ